MAFWNHRDSGWRSRTKLHQKHLFRDSEHTYNRCFWHVFGSMGFLQLEDRNSRTEHYQIQSRSLEIFRRFKGIRIGNSLNRDYTFSFSMKLSPQQLVYDQDANRSRRFILTLGPPWISLLNALYSVSYLWIYGLLLDLVSGFTYFKKIHYKALRC